MFQSTKSLLAVCSNPAFVASTASLQSGSEPLRRGFGALRDYATAAFHHIAVYFGEFLHIDFDSITSAHLLSVTVTQKLCFIIILIVFGFFFFVFFFFF